MDLTVNSVITTGSGPEFTDAGCVNAVRKIQSLDANQRAVILTEEAHKKYNEVCDAHLELEASFDLYYSAIMRGQKLWREEDPQGRELKGPDTGELVAWLLKLVDRAETMAAGRVVELMGALQTSVRKRGKRT